MATVSYISDWLNSSGSDILRTKSRKHVSIMSGRELGVLRIHHLGN